MTRRADASGDVAKPRDVLLRPERSLPATRGLSTVTAAKFSSTTETGHGATQCRPGCIAGESSVSVG